MTQPAINTRAILYPVRLPWRVAKKAALIAEWNSRARRWWRS